MNDNKQRIAIAEACGWIKNDHYEDGFGSGERLVTGWDDNRGIFFRQLPDYLNDLNEMNTVLCNHLQATERTDYLDQLALVIQRKHRMATIAWLCVTASASEKAEAFLRTLNLWTDE